MSDSISREHREVLKHIRLIKMSRRRLPTFGDLFLAFVGEGAAEKKIVAFTNVLNLLRSKACIFDKLEGVDTLP